MKIITWNVNGLRAVHGKGELAALLAAEQPDIVLLQEAKGTREALAATFTAYADEWDITHNPAAKAGYSGTTALVRRSLALSTTANFALPDYPCDEGRVCQLDFERDGQPWSLLGCYFPNGGKNPQAFPEKLKFYQAFLTHINTLRTAGRQVIWGGDVNTCHTAIDIARPKQNEGKIGFHPDERAWLDRCVAANWADVWRTRNPETIEQYSWWSYRGGVRARNVGWRIDYWFADSTLLPQVTRCEYLTEQMGSDHCPLVLELT